MLQTAAILLLESSLNKLIATDSVTQTALAKLSGCVIEIELSDAPVHLYIVPHNRGIAIQQHFAATSDTKLSGSSHNFMLLTTQPSSRQFFGNGLTITGDTQLANTFQRILANAQIDWQGLVGELTGEIVATEIMHFLASAHRQFTISKNSLEMNIAEYLQEEARTLPAGPEIEGFIEDIDHLRSASDRLNARLNILYEKAKTL